MDKEEREHAAAHVGFVQNLPSRRRVFEEYVRGLRGAHIPRMAEYAARVEDVFKHRLSSLKTSAWAPELVAALDSMPIFAFEPILALDAAGATECYACSKPREEKFAIRFGNAAKNASFRILVGSACRNRVLLYHCLTHLRLTLAHAKMGIADMWEHYKTLEELSSRVVVNSRAAWFDSGVVCFEPLLAASDLVRGFVGGAHDDAEQEADEADEAAEAEEAEEDVGSDSDVSVSSTNVTTLPASWLVAKMRQG